MPNTDKKTAPTFYVSDREGSIVLMFWPAESSICISLDFPEAEARRLAAALIAQADKLPRIASAADLGLAA